MQTSTTAEIIRALPPQEQIEYTNAGLQFVYKDSLFALCRSALRYRNVNEHTHAEVIHALQSDTKRKLIVLPRGCLKSSIACVAYPIWLLLRNPNERIMITSELYTNSKTFLREIKLHMESKALTSLFGEFKTEPWNESEIIIKQRLKPYKEASVTAGGVGTTKVGQHYSVIICDDLNSPDNTNTPEAAEKVLNYFRYLISILEPDGTLLVIGTRYSQTDVIGHILQDQLNLTDDPKSGIYEVN